METRFLRSAQCLKLLPRIRHLRHQHTSSTSKPSQQQANPIGDYYASILEVPSPRIKSKPPTTASPRPAISTKRVTDASPKDAGASILFAARTTHLRARELDIQRKSSLVAGVWVPMRPDEPDDCCMSGCVNCVWDMYRDEMEEWVAKRKEAEHALKKEQSLEGARKKRRRESSGMSGSTGAAGGDEVLLGEAGEGTSNTMDDDGGGSETLWGKPVDTGVIDENLFKDIPVGIREFMKQEKRLKEKHAKHSPGT